MRATKGTILVVDDDPDSLALLIGILEQEGYKVQPADSGKLALISVAAQAPDVILLNIRMPGIDGFEVCRRLKQTETARQVPIMFVTASQEKEDWVEALSLGAVDFVSKPFQREELLARISTHLELGRLQAKLESSVVQRTAELHTAIEQLQFEVAERKRAEESFRHIANAAPCIIWTNRAGKRVIFRSEYAEAFTGSQVLPVGDQWAAFVHPDDLDRQQRMFSEGIATGRSFQLEYRVRRADGEYRWMLDKASPLFLLTGEFAGYLGLVIDLTDVKRERERALAAENLENLRVLSAGIAHDFNTLIGAIFGEADLALSDMASDTPGRESVERIVGIAKRAADVVRLLLAYAGDRSETAPPELLDITTMVEELVPHLKSSLLKGAQIRTSCVPKPPAVQANGLQIRQVILNLIVNAVEALEGQSGIVTVKTVVVQIGQTSTDNAPDGLPAGDYVKLEVSDTGRGMSEGVQGRIFDPYFSTKFFGRGLGLAAVQGIIRSHRGTMAVRSTPGEGSTFTVWLPSALTVGAHVRAGSTTV